MPESGYYVSINGETEGPYPPEDLVAWHGEGRMNDATQVWDGVAWMSLGDFLKTLKTPTAPPVQKAAPATARKGTSPLPAEEFESLGGLDAHLLEELNEAEEQIGKAWKAGLAVSILSLLLSMVLFFAGPFMGIPWWAVLIEALMVLGLTYGVRRNSRTCAILLFVLYIADKIPYWTGKGAGGGIYMWILTFVIAYWFLMAIFGTFAWHKINKLAEQVES